MSVRGRLRTVSLIVAASSSAMLGFAYYAQFVMGLLPCILCLYQRPPHYIAAAAALLAFSTVNGPRGLSRALLGLSAMALLAGAGIAFFHTGVELKFWPGLDECGGTLAPLSTNVNDLTANLGNTKIVACDEPSWIFLGLSMAAWNGVISLGLASLALWGMLQGQLRGRFRA